MIDLLGKKLHQPLSWLLDFYHINFQPFFSKRDFFSSNLLCETSKDFAIKRELKELKQKTKQKQTKISISEIFSKKEMNKFSDQFFCFVFVISGLIRQSQF